jgi:hypothetical protein
MKRTWRILTLLTLAVIFVSAAATAQEKKEQKIKIVVADNSGTKVIVDTLFTGDMPDSVKLKDGNVFYIKSDQADEKELTGKGKKNKKVFISYSSDEPSDKKITKEITVIAGDSVETGITGKKEKFITILDGKAIAESSYTVKSDMDDKDGMNTVHYYINKGESSGPGKEKFDVEYRKGSRSEDADKLSYVIAKDGMVITIEGGDEQKIKEISSLIEEKLGVSKDAKGEKKDSKETKKKTDKK